MFFSNLINRAIRERLSNLSKFVINLPRLHETSNFKWYLHHTQYSRDSQALNS